MQRLNFIIEKTQFEEISEHSSALYSSNTETVTESESQSISYPSSPKIIFQITKKELPENKDFRKGPVIPFIDISPESIPDHNLKDLYKEIKLDLSGDLNIIVN